MKKYESGRSMIEMLGVLAIIGVLSIGGLAGYTMAMKRNKVNGIIDYAANCAIAIQSSGNASRGVDDSDDCDKLLDGRSLPTGTTGMTAAVVGATGVATITITYSDADLGRALSDRVGIASNSPVYDSSTGNAGTSIVYQQGSST